MANGMVNSFDIDLGRRSRRLRVDTLVQLRWLAASGQLTAVLVVHFGLGFPLPLGTCLLAIVLLAALNVVLRYRYGRVDRLEIRPASATLAYDVLQLSALLYLTGGIDNPFSMLFLAPILISAVSLSGTITAGLAIFMVALATVVTFVHYPLPWYAGEALVLPFAYSAGIWAAIVIGTSFISIYAWWVAEESRKLADALAATELVIAREQHLTQLDGLAAAAAHELGTPLATIALVAKEMAGQVAPGSVLADDMALLAQEVARCRQILGTLTSLDHGDGNILAEMRLAVLLEEVAMPHRGFDVTITVDLAGEGEEPVCRRNPALIYGLGNLIENAVDFAKKDVRIVARWTGANVTIGIEDDGPGFSPDVILRLGEPYTTTRAGRRAKSEDGAGLGLGLFIAKTLLERSGADVAPANALPPARGARVRINWPRALFERGREAASERPRKPARPV
jgi:two-component system sensor histidine kinase RegB